MRSTLWQLYDNLYYKFERWYNARQIDISVKRRLRKVKLNKEFYDAYKNSIVPYWAKFGIKPGIWWAKDFYLITGSTDPRFLPKHLYYRDIVPFFNDLRFMRPLTDKNLNSILFPNVKRPVTFIKYVSGGYYTEDFSPVPREAVLARFQADTQYIIKPTLNTSSGSDIQFFTQLNQDELDKLLRSYEHVDFIIQETLTQHPILGTLNPTSVNTIRVVTLSYKCKPYILSSILRVGRTNSRVDNVGAGGYQCTIGPDGRLGELAYTNRSGKDEHVPENESGIHFADIVIPNFDSVRSTALSLACKVPHLGLIAWDFSVDPDENVVLIECNASYPGQNQENCGPTFGDMTDEILSDVYRKRMKS